MRWRVLSPHYRGTCCSSECNGSKLARPAGRILGAPGSQASRTYDAIRPAAAKQVALRSARVPCGATRISSEE